MTTKLLLSLSAILCTGGLVASADPITPTFNTFGTLSGATFSGTGINSNAVAISTGNAGGYAVTLGLTATPRYPAAPIGAPLNNNGAGIFSSPAGADSTHPTYANWNFDFYISLTGQGNLTGYVFTLLYGNASSPQSTVLNITGATTIQDSYNFGFMGIPGFDPTVSGQYGAELIITSPAGAPPITDAILINVGSVPDATSTAVLFCLGLGSLTLVGFAKNRWQKA